MTDRKNENGIDAVRLLCAYLVIAIHVPPLASVNNSLNFLLVNIVARVAVPFFFITSGYFVFGSSGPNTINTERTLNYIKKLLSLYLLWSLIYLPFVIRDALPDINDFNSLIKAVAVFLKNFIFTASYGHLWYLPSTAVAVLAVSLLLKLGMKPRRILFFGALLYICGLLGQSYFGLLKMIDGAAVFELLRTVGGFIATTRNGIFEGIIYISLGLCIARADLRLSFPKSLIGAALSFTLAAAEAFILTRLEFIRGYDMFLLTPLAAFFCFEAALGLKLPEKINFGALRSISALIYFSHMALYELIGANVNAALGLSSPMNYLFIAFISTLFSVSVYKLSCIPRLKFLKKFYS